MSNNQTRPLSRVKPVAVFATAAVGALAVSSGLAPAYAEPDYPSWNDVEKAQESEAAKQAEIANIEQLLSGLRASANDAIRESQISAEAYRQAKVALDEAIEREQALATQASEAATKAETSRMRAGLLAAHVARQGGTDLSMRLLLDSEDATDLLRELGTTARLGEQTEAVYRDALTDENAAQALADQAAEAKTERTKLAELTKSTYVSAQEASEVAQDALAEQEERSSLMYEQLAALKNTTAAVERQYAEGVAAEEERQAALAAQAAAEQAAQDLLDQDAQNGSGSGGSSSGGSGSGGSGSGGSSSGGSSSGGSSSGGSSSGGSSSGGGTTSPAPAPAPAPAPSPSPSPAPAPTPNTSAVDTAIAFASAQLGERYQLGAMGPDAWDCSGLTKAAFASAGIYIGTHSATNQYYTLRAQGKAISVSSARRGDLLFWGSGGDYYHVAIYLGNGQIMEAPDWGKPVRIWPTWGSPSAAARPAG